MRFHIVGTQEVLISHSGLVLAGALLQATDLKRRLDHVKLDGAGRPEISHGDNVLSMIGLLCMGKSDFEAINTFEAESDDFPSGFGPGSGAVGADIAAAAGSAGRAGRGGGHGAGVQGADHPTGGIGPDGAEARPEADGVL